MASTRSRSLTLRAEHLYKAALLLFGLAIFFRFFREITQTLLLIYAAAILAVALNAVVRRVPVRRKVMAGLIGVVTLLGIGLTLWFGVPALTEQLRGFVERAPELQASLLGWAETFRQNTGINLAPLGRELTQAAGNLFDRLGAGQVLGGARGALQVILIPFIVLIGGLYALADPNQRLLLPVLRIVPPERRDAYYRIFELLGERLAGWVRGTLMAMLAVGILSSLAFYLIGVPYWLLLGIVNGIAEFIPIFGPWIGGAPAVVIAGLDQPIKGLWSAVAVVAIQQIESYLITPWAMSQAARLHPLVTLFALVFFGSLFGILGILLALPLVIFWWTVIEVLWVERALGSDSEELEPVVEE